MKENERLLPEWVNEQEARGLLGLKQTKVYQLRKEGKLVYSRIGKRCLYALSSIKKYIESNIQSSNDIPHE
jgi:hypothetical protein